MKPASLRLRIALLSVLISGLVLLGFGVGSWYLLFRLKVQGVDTEIRSLGTRHPGWLANRANFDRLNASLEFIFGEERKGQVILLVKDPEGRTLYVSPEWPKTLAPESIDCSLETDATQRAQFATNSATEIPPWGPGDGPGRGAGRGFGPGRGGGPVVFDKIPRFFTVRTSESAWRLGVMGNDDLRLVVGLNYDTVQAELDWMRNLFALAIPVALLLVGGGGWWIASRALRPLKTIARTAEQVTARGLDHRIPISDEDPEILRLIQVLNGMMDRLEASFRQATRFSADASHELKTPLAIMQGELENAIQASATGSPEQRVFGNLLEETHQLKRITTGLLLLAQADAGKLKLASQEILLSDELDAMLEDARITGGGSEIQFQASIEPNIKVWGDRSLLRMALANLVSNAVRYNEPGGTVGVTLAVGDDAVVTICNTGPGIPLEAQARIFDRFYRVRQDGRAAEGHGLGLSLAREIILAHQGKLILKESRPGHTCFEVSLKKGPAQS